MKKLTKKQRQKIYLDSIKHIYPPMELAICGALRNELRASYGFGQQILNSDIIKLFPEFVLFKPDEISWQTGWLDFYGEENKKIRTTILTLCAEMCNN